MAIPKTTPGKAAQQAAADTDTLTAPAPSRAYMQVLMDEQTGDVQEKSRWKYLEGHPRQYRFDAKAGKFNLGGKAELTDTLSFIPLAWHIFKADILGLGMKTWAELYFVDEKRNVSAVLFHGYSVENLYRLIEPLFYDDLTLADVVLTVKAEKKDTVKEGKKASYYIAQFDYQPADPAEVQARREFCEDFYVWREETYTAEAATQLVQGYSIPKAVEAQAAQLGSGRGTDDGR